MTLTPTWAKSSYSDPNGGNCVEARQPGGGTVQVRDSNDTGGPALSFSSDSWQAFADTVKAAGA
jgi:Domain of unknown function (DUF397)